MRREQILFKKWKHLYFWTKLLTSWHQSVTIFLQGQFMLTVLGSPPTSPPCMSAQHLLRCSESNCHGSAQKMIIHKKQHLHEEIPPSLSLLSLWVCLFQVKDKEFWVEICRSIRLVVFGPSLTTPPLSQLRNGFPLFAFLLMLQIANSFSLPSVFVFALGGGPSFVEAGPI